jgi:predicted enzyme related to lactoylglutathione lyase
MNETSYFGIQADAVQRAIDFSQEVFGWKFMKAEGLDLE